MNGFLSKLAPWRRRLIKTLAACALLAVAATAASPLYVSHRFASHLAAARKDLGRRDAAAARAHLRICRDLHPGAAKVHLLLARASRIDGFLADAEFRLSLCQQLGGASAAISLERALLRVQQGRWSLALEEQVQTYIDENHPDLLEILDCLSEAYVKIYRLQSARYCLDLWLGRQPNNVRALLRRGWVHQRQHHVEEAVEDYRQAAAAEEDNTTARLRLAEALLFLERGEEASAWFESLRQQRPQDVEVLLGLTRCRLKLGETEAAQRLLEDLAGRAPRDSGVLLERGRLALQQKQFEQAENWLRQAAELAPYDYQTNYALLRCLHQRGKTEEAEQQQQRVRRIEADMIRMNELTDRLQTRPYDADLRCEIGQLFLHNGEAREGILWLQSAVQVAPDHRPAHQALAQHYEQSGQADLAVSHRRFLQAPPASSSRPTVEDFHDRLLPQPGSPP